MVNTIFYGTNPNTSSLADRVNFAESPVITQGFHLVETGFTIRMNDTRVRNINPNIVSTFQWTGLEGIDITVTGKIQVSRAANLRTGLIAFRSMMFRPQVTEALPHGTIGLVLDRYGTAMNVTPSQHRGLVFTSFELAKPENEPEMTGFVAKLAFNGDIGQHPLYRWF